MRVFIAIDIDEKVRAAVADLQRQLQNKACPGEAKKKGVNWVHPDRMHLTLKFLGEVKDKDIVGICNIVQAVAGGHKGFELDIESAGHFGGRIARVLWAGTGGGSEELCRLQDDLAEQLDSAGWPREARKFTGHLTLCRIKNSKMGLEFARIIKDYKDYKISSVWADSVKVYQSQLTAKGPIYTVLGDYKLR